MIVVIVFLALVAFETWRSFTLSRGTARTLTSMLVTAAIVAFLGAALPWYGTLTVWWWYALVTLIAVYAARVFWITPVGRRS